MPIHINSAEDAVSALDNLLKNAVVGDIEINPDWVNFTLKIHEGDSHSTISTSVMKAFVDYEKRLHHIYALLKYGDAHKKLSNEEKGSLKIVVSVTDGCTNQTIKNIRDIVKHLDSLLDKMSPNQKFILLLAAILLIGGYFVSDTIKELSVNYAREETTRQIVRDALSISDPSGTVLNDSKSFERKLNRGLIGADSVSVSGRPIEVSEIKNQKTDKNVRQAQLNGLYLIENMDFTKDDARIRVEHKGSSVRFWAKLDSFINDIESQKHLLDSAISKKPIFILMNVTYINDEIDYAVAVGINAPNE